jgi:hypothetical protein
MGKIITISFGIIFGLVGIVSIIGVVLGHTHLLIIGIMCLVVAVISYREYKGK